jgi:hypothetical protein
MPNFFRGAFPSPRHRLAAALPHIAANPTPPQFLWNPKQLSMWGNATYGDCTVAEEAFAKSATAGVFVPDATVIAWAQQAGAINGDTLIDVLTKMQSGGFVVDGKTYDDGSPTSVDWTNAALLQNAIAQGPVKIGVAADQLENVVLAHLAIGVPADGWFATGFTPDDNMDHCVSLCGYGPVAWLAQQLGVPFPTGASPTSRTYAYALFTWNSIGIIDSASMIAITGEAWLRNPTTLAK